MQGFLAITTVSTMARIKPHARMDKSGLRVAGDYFPVCIIPQYHAATMIGGGQASNPTHAAHAPGPPLWPVSEFRWTHAVLPDGKGVNAPTVPLLRRSWRLATTVGRLCLATEDLQTFMGHFSLLINASRPFWKDNGHA